MPHTWTVEQALSLAPDDASAKAAQGLASPHRWQTLGATDDAVWGSCIGSASEPYRAQIDLSEPAFKCTCPSRKRPCKHALGLFLLYAKQPETFPQDSLPAWVAEWLADRSRRSAKKQAAESPAGATPSDAPGDTAQPRRAREQSKRAAQREGRVSAGLDELERWLGDLLRQGLVATQSQPARFWEHMAARMVDAQAPGIARRLRKMSSIVASGEGWAGRLLEQAAMIHLLLKSYRRLDHLPAPLQADIRATIGWTLKEDDLRNEAGARDTWLVLGRYRYEEDRLRTQRAWLRGQHTGQTALILDFAYGDQPFDVSLTPGQAFEGEVCFYPGATPTRACVKTKTSDVSPFPAPAAADACFDSVLDRYATAIAANPWLDAIGAVIAGVTPAQREGDWRARDAQGRLLPIDRRFTRPECNLAWSLLALSGGKPMTIFGEWDGNALLPLSAHTPDAGFAAFTLDLSHD